MNVYVVSCGSKKYILILIEESCFDNYYSFGTDESMYRGNNIPGY